MPARGARSIWGRAGPATPEHATMPAVRSGPRYEAILGAGGGGRRARRRVCDRRQVRPRRLGDADGRRAGSGRRRAEDPPLPLPDAPGLHLRQAREGAVLRHGSRTGLCRRRDRTHRRRFPGRRGGRLGRSPATHRRRAGQGRASRAGARDTHLGPRHRRRDAHLPDRGRHARLDRRLARRTPSAVSSRRTRR